MAIILTVLLGLVGQVIGFAIVLAPPVTMLSRRRWSLTATVLWLTGVAFLCGWGPDLQFGEPSAESTWLEGWEQPAAAMVAATAAVLTVPRRSAAGRSTR